MTTKTSNADLRTLDASELDIVSGGVTEGGCVRLPDIIKILQPPPGTPPWFDPTWVRVGRTGTL